MTDRLEQVAQAAASDLGVRLLAIVLDDFRSVYQFVLDRGESIFQVAVTELELEQIQPFLLESALFWRFNSALELSGVMASARVSIPTNTQRCVVSGFSDPADYVRPATPAIVELARFDSVEDAAVAHAVTLEPPEVDFINRAIER